MNTIEVNTQVYDIKINRKWKRVRATNMKALYDWANKNYVTDWRMVGMKSNFEIKEAKKLIIVA